MFQTPLLIYNVIIFIVLFYFGIVTCEQCDFADEECLTASCKKTYKPFVLGELRCEPSDPLHVDVIEGDLTTIKYKLTNATLTGMKDCHVELVRIDAARQKFDYHIACPHLVSESEYEVKGNIGPEYLEGAGTCRVDLYDYYLLFHGDVIKTVDSNGTPHIQIKKYVLNLDAKGKIHYDFKNLFNGNQMLSRETQRFANENWRFVDKLIRKPGMEAYMDKYIKNVNTYLSRASLKDVFHKPDVSYQRL